MFGPAPPLRCGPPVSRTSDHVADPLVGLLERVQVGVPAAV
jgi:hypothetical protein